MFEHEKEKVKDRFSVCLEVLIFIFFVCNYLPQMGTLVRTKVHKKRNVEFKKHPDWVCDFVYSLTCPFVLKLSAISSKIIIT